MASRMRRLYHCLACAGYPRRYVRYVTLPSWWSDHAARSGSGYAEACVFIARRLGLDVAGLLRDPPEAVPKPLRTAAVPPATASP